MSHRKRASPWYNVKYVKTCMYIHSCVAFYVVNISKLYGTSRVFSAELLVFIANAAAMFLIMLTDAGG